MGGQTVVMLLSGVIVGFVVGYLVACKVKDLESRGKYHDLTGPRGGHDAPN